jgi:uncharacterized RDD family membrane protein YckC
MDPSEAVNVETNLDESPSEGRTLAGIVRRWFAFFIDAIIIGFVSVSLIYTVESIFHVDLLTRRSYPRRAFDGLLSFLYFTYFDSDRKAGSLGKQSTSMQVVDEFDQQLTLAASAKRTFCKVLFGWIPLLWLVPAFTRQRQALHDMIAKTYVVEN